MDDLVAEELDTEMLGGSVGVMFSCFVLAWRRDTVIWKKPGKLDPASKQATPPHCSRPPLTASFWSDYSSLAACRSMKSPFLFRFLVVELTIITALTSNPSRLQQ
jgi:hypothetical protein